MIQVTEPKERQLSVEIKPTTIDFNVYQLSKFYSKLKEAFVNAGGDISSNDRFIFSLL